MKHLEWLGAIFRQDGAELVRKEETYKGSWKKRGGLGAFMMLARKWDRLEQMCKEVGYDIFAAIEGSPFDIPIDAAKEEPDGSALAEIRDLRRYLTLVEAEILERQRVAAGEPTYRRDHVRDRLQEMSEEVASPRVAHTHSWVRFSENSDVCATCSERRPRQAEAEAAHMHDWRELEPGRFLCRICRRVRVGEYDLGVIPSITSTVVVVPGPLGGTLMVVARAAAERLEMAQKADPEARQRFLEMMELVQVLEAHFLPVEARGM